MADARSKKVLGVLADLSSRTHFLVDLMTNLREPLGKSDIIDIPSIADLTVVADASATTAAQTVTTSVRTLTANLHPGIFLSIPKISQIQNLDGNWASLIGTEAMVQLKNAVDTEIILYMIRSIVADLSASYVNNGAASGATAQPALSALIVQLCVAALKSLGGSIHSALAWFIHPFAEAEIMTIAGFIPNGAAAEQGKLGMEPIGSLFGIPVFVSQGVQRQRTVASTAYAITSNVQTITVAAGHGLEVGMVVSFNTITASGDINPTGAGGTGLAITATTSTSVSIARTASDVATVTEAGVITVQACENLLVDRRHMFVAQQLMPEMRIVPDSGSSGDIGQFFTVYGRQGRPGRVRTLLSRSLPS